ncbi:MAG: hypothetical protein HN576_10130 [Bacteriovoracaceae bacterium]|jgi:hypothetical protein|nr:hypothetical protein [Bacteriovoracaceae bacterium]
MSSINPIKKIILLFMAISSHSLYATGFSPVLSTSVGIFDLSITENTSTLESTDTTVEIENTEAVASKATVTSFEVNYEFLIYPRKAFYFIAMVPLLSQEGSGIFMGAFGANFYLNSMATVFSYNDKGTSIVITPKFRYYWGASTGIGYVVYNTISAKKSDVFLI